MFRNMFLHFYARSACMAWVVLGWVAWVTVFVWGLKRGLFGWEGGGGVLLDMPVSH